MGHDANDKKPLSVSPTKPHPRRREDDATRPIPRTGETKKKPPPETKPDKKKKKEPKRPRGRDQTIKPSEREATTELDIDDVEVLVDNAEIKGEPTRPSSVAPPPQRTPQPKLPDPFVASPLGSLPSQPPVVTQPPAGVSRPVDEPPPLQPPASWDADVDPFEPPPPLEPPESWEPSADAFEPPSGFEPPESWQDDDIDTSDWSTNPVKRLLKKLRGGS